MPETNEGVAVAPEAAEETETVVTNTVSQEDYDKANETIGSLKRELKDAKKAPKGDAKKETPEKTKPAESSLLEKAFLRTAGISKEGEVELALETAKKWDVSVDTLVDDEDFQLKLEKHRTATANADATSNIKGDKGKSTAKDTSEYWIAKGVPPTAEQVPNRKARAKIARAMMSDAKTSKTFYNE